VQRAERFPNGDSADSELKGDIVGQQARSWFDVAVDNGIFQQVMNLVGKRENFDCGSEGFETR
jgi:hypothetical protein